MPKFSLISSGKMELTFPEENPNVDVWVKETFVRGDEKERAILTGDTYELLARKSDSGIRDYLNPNSIDLTFDGEDKVWFVNVDGLDHLAEVADQHDFAVATETDIFPLSEAVTHIQRGASIEVDYCQKADNKLNSKHGEIRSTNTNIPKIEFKREDNHRMWVKPDENGKICLYTRDSDYPLVGTVTSLTIED